MKLQQSKSARISQLMSDAKHGGQAQGLDHQHLESPRGPESSLDTLLERLERLEVS